MSQRERPLFCRSVRIYMLDIEGRSVGMAGDDPIGFVGQHYHLHHSFPNTATNHIVLGRVLAPAALMEALCDACVPNTRMHGLLIDGAELDPVLHQSVQLTVPRPVFRNGFGIAEWATGTCESYRDWVPDWLPPITTVADAAAEDAEHGDRAIATVIGGPPATTITRQHRRIRIRRE